MKMDAVNDYMSRTIQINNDRILSMSPRDVVAAAPSIPRAKSGERRAPLAGPSGPRAMTAPSQNLWDKKGEFDDFYAARAEAFYQKAMYPESTPPEAKPETIKPSGKAVRPPPGVLSAFGGDGEPVVPKVGLANLRSAAHTVIGDSKPPSMWDHFFNKWAMAMSKRTGQPASAAEVAIWQEMHLNFRAYTKDALMKLKGVKAAPQAEKSPRTSIQRRKAAMEARHEARAKKQEVKKKEDMAPRKPKDDGTMRSHFATVWDKSSSASWGKRTSAAWGGIGWSYDMGKGEDAKPQVGWETQVTNAAGAFDSRHAKISAGARKLLEKPEVKQKEGDLQLYLFGLRSNRLTVQPLRLPVNNVSARTSSKYSAQLNYIDMLASTGRRRGGPLVPVHNRTYDDGKYEDEPDAEPEEKPWTLYGSIWGPRCEWSDGADFFDHEEVLFERFACDWQLALRLGIARMVQDADDDGAGDDDGDGVPDEVEDVGAVLLVQSQLVCLTWYWFADAVYGAGDDLEIGMKENEGFKAFTDTIGVWSHLNKKDQSNKNNQVFSAVDKTDRTTAACITIQSGFRGAKERKAVRDVRKKQQDGTLTEVAETAAPPIEGDVEEWLQTSIADDITAASKAAMEIMKEKSNEFKLKADRQLSRAEFTAGLVKMAIERYVKTKFNPKGEMTDVSDAVERLFVEHVEPALQVPAAGKTQPMLPVPDDFREAVCYTKQLSGALESVAPSLRVIFAGLAKVSFERSRQAPSGALPKIKKNMEQKRDPDVKWMVVSGLMSFSVWSTFIQSFGLVGLNIREMILCFIYSVMCVIDGNSDEGRIKEGHLPFEGFMEALVRICTVVTLPTDEQIEASEYEHAGPLMAEFSFGDVNFLARMTDDQTVEWGSVPDESVSGEMPRRLLHLVDIIVRTIKSPKNPDEKLTVLTRREFRSWSMKNMGFKDNELPESWAGEKSRGEGHD